LQIAPLSPSENCPNGIDRRKLFPLGSSDIVYSYDAARNKSQSSHPDTITYRVASVASGSGLDCERCAFRYNGHGNPISSA
jgi:hypothetical protein